MEVQEEQQRQEQLGQVFESGSAELLRETLDETPIVEVVDFLEEKESTQIWELLKLIDYENQGKIVSEFDKELQLELFHLINRLDFAYIFENMYSDIRADLYQELSKEEQISLLPFLEKKVREDVIALSAYPADTAGGIMNTDFATVVVHMSAEQAIAKIRKDAPSQKMLYYIYAVDNNMQMLGIVSLKDLIMSNPETKVKDLMKEHFIFAKVDEDKEEVAKRIEKYALVAIPILNAHEQLVGIVSYEDAIDVIQDEHTEDMEKFMGIVPSDDDLDYLNASSFQHFKRRIVWIVSLAILSILSGAIIHRFEGALSKLIILALYMPMMADTGGNAGSQAATVVIRAMALGEITPSQWFSILFKEFKIALYMAIVVGILTFGKILFLSSGTQVPNDFGLINIALIISSALTLQVVSSTLIGAGLPVVVKHFNGDPAVVASPAITTIVDITGLLIYFGIATLAFNL